MINSSRIKNIVNSLKDMDIQYIYYYCGCYSYLLLLESFIRVLRVTLSLSGLYLKRFAGHLTGSIFKELLGNNFLSIIKTLSDDFYNYSYKVIIIVYFKKGAW